MASKSLGTLTIDLIAKIGGFVSGMDKAERASEKWRKQVQEDTKEASKAIATMATATAAAATAVGVAGYQLLKSTSSQVAETDKWAKSLNMSTQELLAWQFAAEKAGLSGDNMADIFKDIGDKIGDAVLNKSGEAVDALDALGLSAEKLSKVTPDKQLLAIGDALSKVSTNAGKINILESLGNDLSKMLPLFDNNNEKLKQFLQLAKDYGVAPDPDSIDDLVKVNDLFQDMEAQVKGLKIEIATGLAQVDLGPLQDSLDKFHDVITDPKVLQGLVSLVSQVVELAGWMVKAGAAAGDLASKALASRSIGDSTNEKEISDRLEWLAKARNHSDSWYTYLDRSLGNMPTSQEIDDEMATLRKRLQNLPSNTPLLPTGQATVGTGEFGLPQGGTNGKPKTDTGAKKLESAYKAAEQSYLKQIELIDTTGKKTAVVTEQQKLAFDLATGKLTGLNDAQKKRLEQLATEVDRLNAVKKANEENLKVAEFISNLQSANRNVASSLDIDVQGSTLGDKERERMKERLGIQADFIAKQEELQKQYQSGDITKSLYDKETSALNDAMQERLKIQEEHYQKVDELQNKGTDGFISGLATQIEASMDLYSNMQQVGAQAFSSLTDMIIEWAETGKLNAQDFAATFLQSVGSALLSYAAAQVAMAGLEAFTAMVGIPYVGPAVAPGAAIAAAAAAGVLAIGVSSALSGQAHDGIDSVPETGTWLLQKGERVTTAQTSAKLDATLDRVASQSTAGNVYSPNINIPINGNPSDATVALTRKAAEEGAIKGYQMAVNSIATRQGDLHQVLMGKTNAGVRKR